MARCRLTRNASAGLNLSVTADAVPPPLPMGGLGIPESLASSPEAPLPGATAAETGRSCWGRGQQDASDSAADAGSRNPALSNKVRLRGWTKDSLTASH